MNPFWYIVIYNSLWLLYRPCLILNVFFYFNIYLWLTMSFPMNLQPMPDEWWASIDAICATDARCLWGRVKLENMAHWFIVDLLFEDGDFPVPYVNSSLCSLCKRLPEGINMYQSLLAIYLPTYARYISHVLAIYEPYWYANRT